MPQTSVPSPSETHVGTLVEWDDAKGFGWIENSDRRIFAHIKDFRRNQGRPTAGAQMSYMLGVDAMGRSCAKNVTCLTVGGSIGFFSWLFLVLLLVIPLLAMLWLPIPWLMSVGIMFAASMYSYKTYAYDKKQAINSGQRVPESFLHYTELLGGWPGAFLAQRKLRHKCSKSSYQFCFWFIVLLFQYLSVDLMMDHEISQIIYHYVQEWTVGSPHYQTQNW